MRIGELSREVLVHKNYFSGVLILYKSYTEIHKELTTKATEDRIKLVIMTLLYTKQHLKSISTVDEQKTVARFGY